MKYDHFSTYEWIGEFWTPSSKERFPGRLTYSPENGIELHFMYSMAIDIGRINFLWGALSTGEICTLFGDFDPSTHEIHFGRIGIHKVIYDLSQIVFGEYVDLDYRFKGVDLDLTNFQEFCHPQGYKDSAVFSLEPVYAANIDELRVEIIQSANFKFAINSYENIFYSERSDTIERIKDALRPIIEQDRSLMIRTDIQFVTRITSSAGLTTTDLYKKMYMFECLVAVLLFRPVRQKHVSFLIDSGEQDKKFRPLNALISIFDLSAYKINKLRNQISYFHQHITLRKIPNFAEIVVNWFENFDRHALFAERVNNKFGRSYEYEVKSDIIIDLVQLEMIAAELGSTKNKDKYDLPIRAGDMHDISERFCEILFIQNVSKIGKALSDVRSEIAHLAAGRKNYLKRIGGLGLLMIRHLLDIIIISHIYKSISVSDQAIAEFQKRNLLPRRQTSKEPKIANTTTTDPSPLKNPSSTLR